MEEEETCDWFDRWKVTKKKQKKNSTLMKDSKSDKNTQTTCSFLFNRVVNVWNGLPSNVIDCSTTDIFKKRLDVYLAANPRLELFAPV